MNGSEIPIIGKKYYFFDDGKTSPSRCYVAEVKEIINTKKAKSLQLYFQYDEVEKSLYDIWKTEIDRHRQGENFKVLTGDTTTGAPWLYSESTDYFIACSIPKYDDNLIWFVRDIYGGWFSLNIQSSWQAGRLDVSGEIYENIKNEYEIWEGYDCYDNYLDEVL